MTPLLSRERAYSENMLIPELRFPRMSKVASRLLVLWISLDGLLGTCDLAVLIELIDMDFSDSGRCSHGGRVIGLAIDVASTFPLESGLELFIRRRDTTRATKATVDPVDISHRYGPFTPIFFPIGKCSNVSPF